MLKKIIAIILIILVVFSAVVYIDYFLVKSKGTLPKIAIKEEQPEKQRTLYKSFFYKVIHCSSDGSIILSNYKTDDDVCTVDVKYVDGFYTNSVGLKISKRNYSLMSYMNVYTFNNIDKMTTDEQVNNAAYVAYNYGMTKYEIKKDSEFTLDENGEIIQLAIFPKFVEENGSFKFVPDETNVKCAKKDENGNYVFATFENETCTGEFEKKKWIVDGVNCMKTVHLFIQ